MYSWIGKKCASKICFAGSKCFETDPFPDVPNDKVIATLLSSKWQKHPKHGSNPKILSSREIHQSIQKLRLMGSEVKYISVDVTDTKKLSKEVDHIRQEWGAITGLVHGAGVLADKGCTQENRGL